MGVFSLRRPAEGQISEREQRSVPRCHAAKAHDTSVFGLVPTLAAEKLPSAVFFVMGNVKYGSTFENVAAAEHGHVIRVRKGPGLPAEIVCVRHRPTLK